MSFSSVASKFLQTRLSESPPVLLSVRFQHGLPDCPRPGGLSPARAPCQAQPPHLWGCGATSFHFHPGPSEASPTVLPSPAPAHGPQASVASHFLLSCQNSWLPEPGRKMVYFDPIWHFLRTSPASGTFLCLGKTQRAREFLSLLSVGLRVGMPTAPNI